MKTVGGRGEGKWVKVDNKRKKVRKVINQWPFWDVANRDPERV